MHVVFLKDDDDDGSYAASVSRLGHSASYVPLLEITALPALPALDAALSARPPPRCIAVTSRHAAAILRDACARVHACHDAAACAALRAAPLFAVGARTAAALRGAPCFGPAEGARCGSAAELAPLVVAAAGGGGVAAAGAPPALFVCGEGRLDALPAAARAAGAPLQEVAVYRAAAAPAGALRARWASALEAAGGAEGCAVVFFSPSGVAAAAGAGLLAPPPPAGGLLLHLAIGATTAAALRAAGLPCHGVAARPCAEGVADALCAALRGGGGGSG
jgi:uroporphyrinogen-III synthase